MSGWINVVEENSAEVRWWGVLKVGEVAVYTCLWVPN